MELTAREFLRAVRGKRSQIAFSRRLGFRSNVCAKWESGRRMPTASLALGACRAAGTDVCAAFAAFRRGPAPLLAGLGDEAIALWLRGVRGEQTLEEVARGAHLSRYRVMRFLSGETRPRLPEFFALVHALTRRLSELVALLVDIGCVPTLRDEHARLLASREAVYSRPWSSAVLALLDTERFRQGAPATASGIARTLGISRSMAEQCLEVLSRAGVIERERRGYRLAAPLLTDTGADPERARALRRHWARVSEERLGAPGEQDLYGHSVFAISRADYAELRRMQLDFYQRVRAYIAESRPSELVGFIGLHLIAWDPER